MKTPAGRPYVLFNFLVTLGPQETDGADGGFEACTGLDQECSVADYRGTAGERTPLPLRPRRKAVTELTLKRGAMRALRLAPWLDDYKRGVRPTERTVTITLQNQDRSTVVKRWRLIGARINKYTGPDLCAKGTDLAIEEITLSFDRLDEE